MKSNDNTFIMSPKVDFCFKELLNDEDVRQGFIAAILGVKADMIQRTELLPTYLRKQHQKDKLGILDIRVVLENGTQIDIEMQVIAYDYWAERSLFYLSYYLMMKNITLNSIYGKTAGNYCIRIRWKFIL